MDAIEQLTAEIDAFLKRSGMSAAAFGKAAVNDLSFVRDLRAGREPRRRTIQRVREFIRAKGAAARGRAA